MSNIANITNSADAERYIRHELLDEISLDEIYALKNRSWDGTFSALELSRSFEQTTPEIKAFIREALINCLS